MQNIKVAFIYCRSKNSAGNL